MKKISRKIGNELEDFVGAISDPSKADKTEVAAIENVYGSKNLLPNNATTQTISGVTFTVNADGSVTANGTASATISFRIDTDYFKPDDQKTYILNGCPNGGSQTTYMIHLYYRNSSGASVGVKVITDSSQEIVCKKSDYANTEYFDVLLIIVSGTTVNNLTFKTMIRDARISDATYVPYAMTNRELTDSYSGIINNGVPMLRMNKTWGFAESPINIDNYNVGDFYAFRIRTDGAGFSGTAPTGIGGNTILLMGFSSNSFGIQIAMGFGGSTIAVRNKPYNASGSTWNPWTYLSKTNFINAPERFSMKDGNYETVITFSGTSNYARTPHYLLILAGQTGSLTPINVTLKGAGSSGASIIGVAISDNGGGNVTVSNNSIIINNIVGGGWGYGILMNLIPYDNPTYTITNRAKS